jgi:hypothetical protein
MRHSRGDASRSRKAGDFLRSGSADSGNRQAGGGAKRARSDTGKGRARANAVAAAPAAQVSKTNDRGRLVTLAMLPSKGTSPWGTLAAAVELPFAALLT